MECCWPDDRCRNMFLSSISNFRAPNHSRITIRVECGKRLATRACRKRPNIIPDRAAPAWMASHCQSFGSSNFQALPTVLSKVSCAQAAVKPTRANLGCNPRLCSERNLVGRAQGYRTIRAPPRLSPNGELRDSGF